MKPIGKPGENIQYSSIGFMLTGMAIQGLTGLPYHKVVREQVLDPLGLTNTYETNSELPSGLETSHHYFGYIDLAHADPSFEFADGGFVTTADELAKLGKAIINGDVLETKEAVDILLTPLSEKEGFGFFWEKTAKGVGYFYQPGFWGVRFMVFPDQRLVVTFTLNQSNTSAQKFMRQVIQLLEDKDIL